jgi:phospholipid/cholesterol/gamma-HCH transport system substrate-binding protein
MNSQRWKRQIRPGWWTLMLVATLVALALICSAFFVGTFRSYDVVTLTADRAGLVMESGARVKMRGVDVGRVGSVSAGAGPVSLKLEMSPDQMRYIPANVRAEIKATTVFGAKYVELISPPEPSSVRLAPGAVLHSGNVATEVNTVFENLVGVLDQIDVAKLNATLTALADGLRGQGQRIGEATTDANQVLTALNARTEALDDDWRALNGFNRAYARAAPNILDTLKAASTTSETVITHANDLDALLLNTIGFSQAGINLLAHSKANLVRTINAAKPTTDLLMNYNPQYTCMLVGAKWFLDNGGYDMMGGGNGRSLVVDAGLLLGDDPYHYPDNLPLMAAKGGPGGKPGCGSLPDASKNFPVRQLVTNTGWGTGTDIRTNPGIGHPCWGDFLPVTRGDPRGASIRPCLPGPAPGPIPYPGAPPYGAPLYGPNGVPLYLGVPPAPSPQPGQPPPEPTPAPGGSPPP